MHAPGTRSLRKFLAGTHHVNLCQSAGASVLRAKVPDANVGTTHIISPMATQLSDGFMRVLPGVLQAGTKKDWDCPHAHARRAGFC